MMLADDLLIEHGTPEDFRILAYLHYRSALPPAVTQIWTARERTGDPDAPPLGVLVMARPPLSCHLRDRATQGRYALRNRSLGAALVNRDFRIIARVIVAPRTQRRGLATRLVRHALAHAETRYTETLAAKARTHPFFERSGMTPYDRPPDAPRVRLLAALAYAGLQVDDLAQVERCQAALAALGEASRDFLHAELCRFAGPKAARLSSCEAPAPDSASDATCRALPPALLDYAHQRLVYRPLYLLWERPATAPAVAMPEVLDGVNGSRETRAHKNQTVIASTDIASTDKASTVKASIGPKGHHLW